MGQESELSLADAIDAVRAQLKEAQRRGQDSDVRFTIGDIELEFVVDVRRGGGGHASVTVLNLLSAGGNLERTTETTNRVTVSLNAVTVNGDPLEVAKESHGRPGG